MKESDINESKIIEFCLEANKLKNVIRTGWKEVGVSTDKIESVADHIYGCMTLALTLISENDYSSLDLLKVFKMLILKELTKVRNMEQSVISKEERKEDNRNTIVSITNGLTIQPELIKLYDELISLNSEEAKFVLYISKLESDIQAKIYELNGEFTLENAMKDIENYPEEIKNEIKSQVHNASDGWILFDRQYYHGNEIFESLSVDIQNLKG